MNVKLKAAEAVSRELSIFDGDRERLFRALLSLPWPVWLDSAARFPHGRFSIMAADPAATLSWRGSAGTLRLRDGREERVEGNPFTYLRSLLPGSVSGERIAGRPEGIPFAGGAIGFFGYDLGRHLEELPGLARDDVGAPDLFLGIYDLGLTLDHDRNRAHLWAVDLRGDGEAEARVDFLARCLEAGLGPAGEAAPAGDAPAAGGAAGPPEWSLDGDGFRSAVAGAREYIRAGEIFQVNLSRRLRLPWRGDPLSLYFRLRHHLPEAFCGYQPFPGGALLSASPELFLRLEGGRVTTRPIKGTRPRGADTKADALLRKELLESSKDRAELMMIVDLERNDLGKVCRPFSVAVPELFIAEAHPAVHHLVSTVTGELRPGLGAIDLLEAAFPGGSITGAPKVRAMEIIEELEPVRRGPYTGAFGFIGYDGDMELSIIIRTLVLAGGVVDLHVGCGIVADSDTEEEYRESRAKARGMIEALGLSSDRAGGD